MKRKGLVLGYALGLENMPLMPGVALEAGFFDKVRKFFTGPKKGEDFNRDEWERARRRGLESVAELLHNTLADPDWVDEHYHDAPVKLGKKDLGNVLVGTKVQKPMASYDASQKEFDQACHTWAHQIATFKKEWEAALNEIEAFYLREKPSDAHVVEKYAEKLIKKIHVPGEADVRGNAALAVYSQRWQVQRETVEKIAEHALPVLSKDEVKQIGKALLAAAEALAKGDKLQSTLYFGSDFDEKFWDDHDSYEGEILRTGIPGDFFYEQGTPEQVRDLIAWPYYEMGEAFVASLAWAAHQCGAQSFST